MFATHGYAGGTTNRIAEEAALSVGSVYQYFPNKDSVLVELAVTHVERRIAALITALPTPEVVGRPGGLEELIRCLITVSVRLRAADRRLGDVIFEESPKPASLPTRLRELETVAVDAVAERLVAGGVAGSDPTLRARIILVTSESLVRRFVDTDPLVDTDRVIEETSRLVHAYLTA